MVFVIKYPADVIFRAARAFFVFEHFQIARGVLLVKTLTTIPVMTNPHISHVKSFFDTSFRKFRGYDKS